ncbi:hypothetical protein OF83DRAFT_1057292 [Amylostereum chailletii]|nr:hypothetical protein OF83DRAFT_1057292 [Amylostereum chailletii]
MDRLSAPPPNGSDSKPRGRGRGRSRGGLGKYLRARGRGRGGGRPAEFRERLVLEGERTEELEEEEARELEAKFSRRQLGTNADRYVEPEPELDSDGEEVVEPEVDLSKFLERQRSEALPDPIAPSHEGTDDDDDDVDHSLAHITSKKTPGASSMKGKIKQIEWDASFEEMSREKAEAEARWDLKDRFRAKVAQQKSRPATRGGISARPVRRQEKGYIEAPPLPTEQGPRKDQKTQMEDFLDDLLS